MTYLHRSVIVLATLFAGGAVAQDSGSSSGRMDDIVVTARKTEENLQDIPIAVSAFSAQELERRSIRELEDVALATPGFSFEDYGGGYGAPVVRGGSQLRIQDLESTTSVYLDGIYLARQYMYDIGTLGLERVEVVKGPQSALFGRNAFLGAVNYIGGGPGDEFGTRIESTIGSDDRFDLSGEISGPIFGEKLRARVFGGYSEFDGTFENELPGYQGRDYNKRGTTDNLGGFENKTYGINLESQLTDALFVDFDYYKFERFQEAKAGNRVEAAFGDTNCSFDDDFLGGANRFYCGEIPQEFSPLPGGAPPGTDYLVDPRAYLLDANTDFVQAGARYDISESWRVAYQFGYTDSDTTAAGSNDRDPALGSTFAGAPAMGVNVTAAGTNEYYSHELRVEFSQGQWTAMFGGFTSQIDDFDLFDFAYAPFQDGEPFRIDPKDGISCPDCPLVLALTRAKTKVETDAIFGRIGWQSANERWGVSVEGRYQDEKKKLDPNTADPASPKFDDSWTEFTPRFTLDYRLAETNLLYSSVARGAKSGGFNNTVFDESQRAYDPDKNWTYEIGSKNDFFNGSLRLNAAVYYTDWDDLQINSTPIGIPPGVTPPAIIDNTGGAEIWGLEIDGTWIATEMLSFDYAVSYTNAEYSNDSKSSRIGLLGACDGTVCPADGDIDGNQLQRQPETQASFGVVLQGTVAGDWNWFARGDVNYQDKQYMDELNLAYLPERTLVNLRAELNNGPWTLAIWGKNVFDEDYGANGFFIASPFGTSYVPLYGDLRTFGATLSFAL